MFIKAFKIKQGSLVILLGFLTSLLIELQVLVCCLRSFLEAAYQILIGVTDAKAFC